MLTVHVRVNDSTTGKPTPVRLRLVDAEGRYRPPLGRLAEFAVGPGQDVGGQVLLGGRAYAYIDGACEARLPAGNVTVELSKGPEYVPVRREVPLAAGQISLRLTIERWADWRADGWYAGDTRAVDLPPHAALLEGAAEGLAVVQLLARERPGAVTNLLAFSGAKEALRSAECLVAVNTFNEHPVLGSVSLLNCHRPVFPLRAGLGAEPWSVADWCDQCHRKTGLAVWSGRPRSSAGEALAALVLGKIDAYEISVADDGVWEELGHYYRLLDADSRPVLVGGSGKDTAAVALGAVRTYARLAEGQTLEAAMWIEAVRAGRTFVTTGPLLSLTVAGLGPGRVVRARPGERVPIRTLAHGLASPGCVEVLVGGERVGSSDTSGVVETEISASRSTWIVGRCTSAGAWAHTSPVWLDVPGRPVRPSNQTLEPLLTALDGTAAWLDTGCEDERHREHVRGVLRSARDVLLARRDAEDAAP